MLTTSIPQIKADDLNNGEKRAKHLISIIGCNFNGIIHTCLFAEAGYKVTCVDADQSKIDRLNNGKITWVDHEIETKLKNYSKTRQLIFTKDIKTSISQSNIVVITVPTEFDGRNKPDYSLIEKTCKLVGSHIHQGTLIIITSIVGIGIFEKTLKEILENTSGFKAGIDFALTYAPIHIM